MLAKALSLHQKGALSEARALYREILEREPDNHEALHLLGALALQSGQPEEAECLIGRAIELNPRGEIYYGNRANALRQLNRMDEAMACLEAGIARNPEYAEAYYNKGVLLAEQQRHGEAVVAFEQAIARRPGHAESHFNKGNALLQEKAYAAAIACYAAAIARRPNYAKAYYNQGNAWRELKDDAAAVAAFSRAIELDSGYAKAYYNRGNALQSLKRHAEAVADYDHCVSLRPDDDVALVNKGNALLSQRQYASALGAYDRAIEVNPEVAAYHNNKGNAFLGLHRTDCALDAYGRAIEVDPLEKDAHFNQAICLLLTGDLARGFEKYEWRWQTGDLERQRPDFAEPAWRGEQPLAGKRILLYCEQGLGDTLQFVRYVRQVGALGAHVILVVQPPLLELMKTLDGGGQLVADGSPLPPFDYHCPLLSLPLAFATRLETIPASPRYLAAEPAKVEAWQQLLGARRGLRVGLAWSGRPEHKNDENRSLALADFLSALPAGLDLVCLQKELRDSDRATLAARPDIRFFGERLADFSDTAALCENMDLVLSVDTSVAHLAAALGKPTWILLPFVPDWRWLLDRQDSPWYPSVRLFRQPTAGDWGAVLAEVRAALAGQTARPQPTGRPAHAESFTTDGRLPVLMNWPAAPNFGWGLLGLNLFLNWANDRQLQPLLGHKAEAAQLKALDPLRLHAAWPAIEKSNQFVERFLGDGRGLNFSFPLLDPLGNGLVPLNDWRGAKTIGRCIFEDTDLRQLERKLAKYDCLLTASRWNRDLLAAASGRPVELIHEGIDHALFFPGPRSGLFDGGRFHVFCGGKIEYRKAQDLVLKAFAIFAARHPDAVLVTAWHSPFAKHSLGFRGILEHPLQRHASGRGIDVVGWAEANGVARRNIIDLGPLDNPALPGILREMDCALQVSRAEACTNLPAKEAMACGIPVVLAANTGVLDLIDDDNCLALREQGAVAPELAGCGVDGWGESRVEDIVEALERLYADSALRRRIGQRGAAWIVERQRTWREHARQLKALVLA